MPSHHASPSGVHATFVKMEFFPNLCIALRMDLLEVPESTPKNPDSGLMAYSLPSSPTCIQAMLSSTQRTFQPGTDGTSIARLVLPPALGKAAAM